MNRGEEDRFDFCPERYETRDGRFDFCTGKYETGGGGVYINY